MLCAVRVPPAKTQRNAWSVQEGAASALVAFGVALRLLAIGHWAGLAPRLRPRPVVLSLPTGCALPLIPPRGFVRLVCPHPSLPFSHKCHLSTLTFFR